MGGRYKAISCTNDGCVEGEPEKGKEWKIITREIVLGEARVLKSHCERKMKRPKVILGKFRHFKKRIKRYNLRRWKGGGLRH